MDSRRMDRGGGSAYRRGESPSGKLIAAGPIRPPSRTGHRPKTAPPRGADRPDLHSMNAAVRIGTVPSATDPRHRNDAARTIEHPHPAVARSGGEALTRLRLSGTGHIVLGLITLWGFLILATAMTVGTAE